MLHNLHSVTVDNLRATVEELHRRGFRLVTLTCTDLIDNHDILYHFEREGDLYHLRLTVSKDWPVPSISGIYLAAALVENEIKDLFGVEFDGLAIDYGGRFILAEDAPAIPLGKMPAAGGKKGE